MNRLLEEAATNQNDNLLPLQQVMEVNDGGRSALPDIHPRLRRSSGLDEHVPTPKKRKTSQHSLEQDKVDTQPVIVLETISNAEVKRWTGFGLV